MVVAPITVVEQMLTQQEVPIAEPKRQEGEAIVRSELPDTIRVEPERIAFIQIRAQGLREITTVIEVRSDEIIRHGQQILDRRIQGLPVHALQVPLTEVVEVPAEEVEVAEVVVAADNRFTSKKSSCL